MKGFAAPHKPLLLLAIIDLVGAGLIRSNRIELTEELITQFKNNESRYIGDSPLFTPDICKPFYHMQSEPFWQLIPKVEEVGMAAEQSLSRTKRPVSYSVSSIRSKYHYAVIDPKLLQLMQDKNARAYLRVTLISTYFASQPKRCSTLSLLSPCIALLTLIA